MLLIALFVFLLVPEIVTENTESEFQKFAERNKETVDRSSLATCYALGGVNIERVSNNNVEKGYKCTVALKTLSEDEIHAKEVCESRLPYYIIGTQFGSSTSCTFQINVECDTAYWQINRKCYKVSKSKMTWQEAQNYCKVKELETSGMQPKVAEYYSTALNNYLNDVLGISSAWVYVPELKDYFVNGEGNAAIYVQDGAFKFDTRRSTILMDHLTAKHQALCEYTAPMTKAEMFYISDVYSEIYPINVYDDGAIIPSSDFTTIEQTKLLNNIEQFTTDSFKERCSAIGRIINVESFPITAIEVEFNAVKDYLTNERFHLTNAYKNDGKKRNDYRQKNQDGTSYQIAESDVAGNSQDFSNAHSFSFHKSGRFPTMAAMRAPVLCALHSFNWKFGDCPRGPAWSENPVRHERNDSRIFCHYISNKIVATYDEARRLCEADGLGASLSGFDDEEEFKKIKGWVRPEYPPDSRSVPDSSLPILFFKMGNEEHRVDNHYWLGGVSPCRTDCALPGGKTHVASWDEGVGINTGFLNSYNHEGHPWESNGDKYVSFRSDKAAFHVHPLNDPYTYMFFICGKTAPLVRSEKNKAGVLTSKG